MLRNLPPLAETWVTDVGLAQLAPATSLEVLAIGSRMLSPSGLATLSEVKRLRNLHVGGRSPFDRFPPKSELALDNDTSILVLTSELADFRRALETLRRSNAGILIDNQELRLSELDSSRFVPDTEDLGWDALPERQSAWWPASEWPALSPSEKADFHKKGGWARFDAAGWGPNGPTARF